MLVANALGARSSDAETMHLQAQKSTAEPRSAARLRILADQLRLVPANGIQLPLQQTVRCIPKQMQIYMQLSSRIST